MTLALARLVGRWDNPVTYRLSRALCHLGAHSKFCRGRRDHVLNGKLIGPGRWA